MNWTWIVHARSSQRHSNRDQRQEKKLVPLIPRARWVENHWKELQLIGGYFYPQFVWSGSALSASWWTLNSMHLGPFESQPPGSPGCHRPLNPNQDTSSVLQGCPLPLSNSGDEENTVFFSIIPAGERLPSHNNDGKPPFTEKEAL